MIGWYVAAWLYVSGVLLVIGMEGHLNGKDRINFVRCVLWPIGFPIKLIGQFIR